MNRPMAFRPFYRGDCERQIEEFRAAIGEIELPLPPPRAAVAPHAGWAYSGRVAARAVNALAPGRPETIVMLGAVHRAPLDRPALWSGGAWETPLGEVEIDPEVAGEILASEELDVADDPSAHLDEHSLEVLAPLVRAFLPRARVVPILVPPVGGAASFGASLGRLLSGRPVSALASTDLTHYGSPYGFTPAGIGAGAHDWMRENDRRVIERAIDLDAEGVLAEAGAHANACGAGALAAAVAFARQEGSPGGRLLERTDSHDEQDPAAEFTMAVGYAALAL